VGEDSVSRNERNEYLFHHLVAMFQTLALQQLGKLVNPITDKMERDLHQAKITIDMLQMLKDRTMGNLEQSERLVLDRALLELQMNFVDESKRGEDFPAETEKETGPEETAGEGTEIGRAGQDSAEQSVTGNQGDAGAENNKSPEAASKENAGTDAPAPEKGGKKAKTAKRKSSKKKKTN
jgi:hypothetical protein